MYVGQFFCDKNRYLSSSSSKKAAAVIEVADDVMFLPLFLSSLS